MTRLVTDHLMRIIRFQYSPMLLLTFSPSMSVPYLQENSSVLRLPRRWCFLRMANTMNFEIPRVAKKASERMLEMELPSNLLNYKRNRLIPQAIEIGGACWIRKRSVKFQIICFFTHRERCLSQEERDSDNERSGTEKRAVTRKTK